MTSLPLRVRVAAAFAATTTLVLAVVGAGVYLSTQSALQDQARAGLVTQLDALEKVPAGSRSAAVGALTGPTFAQVADTEGRPLTSSPQLSGPLLPAGRVPETEGDDLRLTRPVRMAEQGELEDALLLARRTGDRVLVVGTSREDVADTLQTVLVRLLLGSLAGVLAASLLGYLVAGAALRPVESMRRRAAEISSERPGERLPIPPGRDELSRLGETLNAMLDRLDAGLRRERRFVSEAGHELRTPLALLRMELDLALSRPRTHEELVAALESATEEVERLTRLSEDLLLVDSGTRPPPAAQEVRLDDLVGTVTGRFAAAFGGAGRNLTSQVDEVTVRGSRPHLERLLTNLVDNALRHGGGDVTVTAHRQGTTVAVEVRDEGAGVPLEVREHAFVPFARAPDAPRGNGLGLTIVRAIARSHGGDVDLASDGSGTRVTVTLPLTPPPAGPDVT